MSVGRNDWMIRIDRGQFEMNNLVSVDVFIKHHRMPHYLTYVHPYEEQQMIESRL